MIGWWGLLIGAPELGEKKGGRWPGVGPSLEGDDVEALVFMLCKMAQIPGGSWLESQQLICYILIHWSLLRPLLRLW